MLLFFPSPPTIIPSLHTLAVIALVSLVLSETGLKHMEVLPQPLIAGVTGMLDCVEANILAFLTFSDRIVSFLPCPLIFLDQGWQLICTPLLGSSKAEFQ